MKLLLLSVICFITIAYTLADKEEFEKLSKMCGEEVNVSEADMKAFIQNGMKASDATEPMKCHMKCLMEKQGFLKAGVYDSEAAIKHLKAMPHLATHQAEIEEAINKCKNEKGSNDCDTAFRITMCVKEAKGAM